MKEYALCKPNDREYNGFLLCLTFESIFSYLNHIEAEPLLSHTAGSLLVDQLLITGNGRNRYISCSFDNGKINMASMKIVSPSEYYRKLSLDLLQHNLQLLHNSILTEYQLECVQKGIVF